MYIAGRWADRRLSKLELACATILLGIITFFLLQHMLKIFARAESTMLATSIMNMNTTLQYRAAWYRMTNDHAALAAMQGMNAFTLDAVKSAAQIAGNDMNIPAPMLGALINPGLPSNYMGEQEGIDPAEVEGGHWYYDRPSQVLVYRVRNDEYFYSELPGSARAEYQVEIDYEDRNQNNLYEPAVDVYRGIGLISIGHYEWQL